MTRIVTIAAILFSIACAAAAESEVRFRTVDVVIDAGADALAAYQVEITADGDASILSVEGGEHPAFNPPPYFDRVALQGRRIRLAAFSTSADLPSGRTRVATLHVRESGAVTYRTRLLTAARAGGRCRGRADRTVFTLREGSASDQVADRGQECIEGRSGRISVAAPGFQQAAQTLR